MSEASHGEQALRGEQARQECLAHRISLGYWMVGYWPVGLTSAGVGRHHNVSGFPCGYMVTSDVQQVLSKNTFTGRKPWANR